MTWPEAFVWTCAIETPVYVALLRRRFRAWWAPVALSLALQALTHPTMWALFPRSGPFWPAFLAFELGVAAAEGLATALVLRRAGDGRPWRRGMAAALLANAASAAVGLL